MRPVNLIPPEERRGDKAPSRTGPVAYLLVALLAGALVATTAVVLTDNKISDRTAEKASLESQVAVAQQAADRLKSFADFASLQQAREVTVTSLAKSRFDWERVLRELAIVIPSDVWLADLSAKVSPGVQLASSASSGASSGVSGTDGVTGPTLEISGCAASHEAVARFLAALRDVDGVTRASVLSSDRPDTSATGAGGSTGASTCATRKFISQFRIAAAFDAVAVPAAAAAPAPSTAPAASTADQSQVSDGQQQLNQQSQSAAQATQKARNDVNTFIPGSGGGQ